MSIKTTLKLTALSTLAALAFTSHAQAEGKLTSIAAYKTLYAKKSLKPLVKNTM